MLNKEEAFERSEFGGKLKQGLRPFFYLLEKMHVIPTKQDNPKSISFAELSPNETPSRDLMLSISEFTRTLLHIFAACNRPDSSKQDGWIPVTSNYRVPKALSLELCFNPAAHQLAIIRSFADARELTIFATDFTFNQLNGITPQSRRNLLHRVGAEPPGHQMSGNDCNFFQINPATEEIDPKAPTLGEVFLSGPAEIRALLKQDQLTDFYSELT